MTEPEQLPHESVAEWITKVIAAAPEDRRRLAIDAMGRSGIALEPLRCVLHGRTLNFVGMVRHIVEAEAEFTRGLPDDAPVYARLHKATDIRPPRMDEGTAPLPWSYSHCRTCGAKVIWADTMKGKRNPIDFDPSPSGSIMLVRPAEGYTSESRPIAVVLHTEAERETAPQPLHTSHFATCPNANDWRRSP